MPKKGQQIWLMEGAPGTERERVEAFLAQTQALRDPAARASLRRRRVERTPMQKLAHTGFSFLFWLMVVALVAIIFTAFESKRAGDIPSVLGYSVMRVETGSMVPTLPIGSFVVTRAPDDPAALKEGVIVTFRRSDGMVVTHRIIDVLAAEDGGVLYQTKGDNPQNSPDSEYLTPDRVIGAYAFRVTLPSVWGGN